jgi:hypothetical protein
MLAEISLIKVVSDLVVVGIHIVVNGHCGYSTETNQNKERLILSAHLPMAAVCCAIRDCANFSCVVLSCLMGSLLCLDYACT